MNGEIKNFELQSVKDCVQNIPFEDLAPATNVDISNYKQVLDQAFSNPRLKNIAITGPYGAGKSSILESYLQSKEAFDKKYANLCLRISLAHFQPTKEGNKLTEDEQGTKAVLKDGEVFGSNYQMEQLLEGKIINQILHKIPTNIAKAAGFRMVDTDKESESKAFNWGAAVITGILVAYFCIPTLGTPVISHFSFVYNNLLLVLRLLGAIAIIIFAVLFSYNYGKNIKTFFSRLQRVKFEGNEIELFQSKDDAYFDKYLDSILYMIDHSGKEFFIFEDIDRFDTTLIFERLKEVNELVNDKRKLRQATPIKFIYLLRDDIFLNKDRTKFFDFLVPVIPVTNTKNSSDKLFAILEKYHLKDAITPDLVRALGLYIEDYRLIINIANEFRIYFAALGQRNKLNPDKMLAMIVYKNLFPRDFVDLQKQKGYVHFLLSKRGKDAFVSEKRAELEKEEADCMKKLKAIKAEIFTTTKELAWAIIGTKFNNACWRRTSLSNDTNKDLSALESYIENERGISQDAKDEYKKRKAIVEADRKGQIDSENERLNNIRKQLEILDTASFSMLASMFVGKSDNIFLQNGADNNGNKVLYDAVRANSYFNLLKYLLISGNLDETFAEYTTFFYGESLSENDQAFLMNLHENGAPKWDLKLTNFSVVLQNISVAELTRPAVLNYSLLLHKLSFSELDDAAQSLEKMFCNFKGEYFGYAIQFISKGEKVGEFVTFLFRTLPNSFGRICAEPNLNADIIESLAYYALLYLNEDELKELNEKSTNSLAQYITNNPDFLQGAEHLDDTNFEKIISSFRLLDIKFPKIHSEGVPSSILEKVFSNCLCVVNGNILWVFFTVVLKESSEEAKTKPLTILNKLPKENSFRHCLVENFDLFVSAVLENLERKSIEDEYFEDSSDIIVELINRKSLKDKAVVDYLSRLIPETIPMLSDIKESDNWRILVAKNLVKHTDYNLYLYIKKFGADDILINCLNHWYAQSPMISTRLKEQEQKIIMDAIVPKSMIDTGVYISILENLDYYITDHSGFDTELFPEDKIAKLIQKNCMDVNKDLFDFLQNRYPKLLPSYVKIDRRKFADLLERQDASLTSADIDLFLGDDTFSNDEKLLFVNHTNGSIALLPHRNISEDIQCIIVEDHLQETEISKLIEQYNSLSEKVRKTFLRAAEKYVDYFMKINTDKNRILLHDIMQSPDIEKLIKVKILTSVIKMLDFSQTKDMLSAVDAETYGKILKAGATRHIAVALDEDNNQLFEALKTKGWIRNYDSTNNEYIIQRMPTTHN
uniref:YobI family P-loop NTPase n=1 Tax=uncultured Allisonella sp. TaxID=339338 RepID=UPI00259AAC52|nr:hypothetical protein [uncultured Allisonella sp.]